MSMPRSEENFTPENKFGGREGRGGRGGRDGDSGDRGFDRGDRGDRGGRDDRDDSDDQGKSSRRLIGSGHRRRKVCRFCTDEEMILDYKVPKILQSFLTEHGKIVPRRISGNCSLHQRKLTLAVKRARNLALVGFVTIGLN